MKPEKIIEVGSRLFLKEKLKELKEED